MPKLSPTGTLVLKVVILSALDAGAVYLGVVLGWAGSWGFLAFLALGVVGLNVLVLSRKPIRSGIWPRGCFSSS